LCRRHYIEVIDKRFKREIDLKKNATYVVRDKVIEYMLKKNLTLKFRIVKKGKYPEIKGYTSEYFVNDFLKNLLKGDIKTYNGIYPLQNITYDEIKKYLSASGVKIPIKKPYWPLVSSLEHFGIDAKHSTIKSMKDLKRFFVN